LCDCRQRLPSDRVPAIDLYDGTEMLHKGQSSQAVALVCEGSDLLGMHPAGNGLLEGGRSKPREYAQ
jgi:hypothetical protein